MLKIIDKKDLAERKKYTFSRKTLEKMRRIKKEKQIKKEKLANAVIPINSLEFDPQNDILCDHQIHDKIKDLLI